MYEHNFAIGKMWLSPYCPIESSAPGYSTLLLTHLNKDSNYAQSVFLHNVSGKQHNLSVTEMSGPIDCLLLFRQSSSAMFHNSNVYKLLSLHLLHQSRYRLQLTVK